MNEMLEYQMFPFQTTKPVLPESLSLSFSPSVKSYHVNKASRTTLVSGILFRLNLLVGVVIQLSQMLKLQRITLRYTSGLGELSYSLDC